MEVVELVEVSGQGHQVIENFDDLILTVVPEGEEGAAGSGEGQRTIVVTEVRGPHHGMEDQNSKIESLQSRVEQLEDQVHFLEDELRLIRRKVVQQGQGNPMSTHSAIRKTVLEILRKQTVKISVSDFEDELDSEPAGRGGRLTQGQKRRQYENGFSDDDDEDWSDAEEPPVRKRRGPGRPPKSQSGYGRKLKTHRVELTPPPPKTTGRPRGRPRRTLVEVTQEEDTPITPSDEVKDELVKPEPPAGDEEEEVAPENTTVEEMETTAEGEDQENEVETKAVEADAEGEDTLEDTPTAPVLAKEVISAVPAGGTTPKKGRRRVAAEVEKEPEPTPLRTSTRARKTSRKGSD